MSPLSYSQVILVLFQSLRRKTGQEWASIVGNYQDIVFPGTASISVDVHRFLREFNWSQYQPGSTPWQYPSFFAYFSIAGTFGGTLGYFLSSSTTNPGYVWKIGILVNRENWLVLCLISQWFASPACTELEAVVMDWAAKMARTAQHLLECNRGWWRGYPSQILFFSCTYANSILPIFL